MAGKPQVAIVTGFTTHCEGPGESFRFSYVLFGEDAKGQRKSGLRGKDPVARPKNNIRIWRSGAPRRPRLGLRKLSHQPPRKVRDLAQNKFPISLQGGL